MIFIITVLSTIAVFSPDSSLLEYIPHSFYETLGANIVKRVKEEYTVKWPLVYMIFGIGLATIVSIFLLYLGSSRFRMRESRPTEA